LQGEEQVAEAEHPSEREHLLASLAGRQEFMPSRCQMEVAILPPNRSANRPAVDQRIAVAVGVGDEHASYPTFSGDPQTDIVVVLANTWWISPLSR
jgi:hypothetical protein